MSVRRLNQPEPAQVLLDERRRPARVRWGQVGMRGAQREAGVERVLDTWYVDDGWWTDTPVRRIYHECQLDGGTRRILVYDLTTKSWLIQR